MKEKKVFIFNWFDWESSFTLVVLQIQDKERGEWDEVEKKNFNKLEQRKIF